MVSVRWYSNWWRGPTLADRIKQGPIPLDEALPIAKQIAEALEAAHEAGVIHRDLKPANIKVKDDGTVKVLDFGLAKALDPSPEGDPSQSPTLTAAATQMGVIMGTAAYMSPEQASGQTADKRSDIWSFGVVLYEMLTGQGLFTGETISHILAKVLDRELDFSALPTSTPAPIKRLLRRCLERKPKRRLADVGEALIHLEEAASAPAEGSSRTAMLPAAQPAGWRQALPWAVSASVVVGMIVGLTVWSLRPALPPQMPMRFVASAPPSPVPLPVNSGTALAISPDGTVIAYRATVDGEAGLYVRHVDRLDGELLWSGPVGSVVFSPDGSWIAFFSGADQTLKKIPALGGLSVTLCPMPFPMRGASWGPDDTIIFGAGGARPLFRVSAAGGEPEVLRIPDSEQDHHHWPEVLPGGRAVLFTVESASTPDTDEIAALDLETGEQRVVVRGGSHPRYLSSGHLVYSFEDTLRAVRFDPARLEVLGDPIPVLEGVTGTPNASGRGANVDISDDGTLVYQWDPEGAAASRTLVWVDRNGQEEPIPMTPRAYRLPQLSPDGRRLAVDTDGVDANLFLYDLDAQVEEQFTFDLRSDQWPLWSRDGSRIYFQSGRDGAPPQLFVKPSDGSGQVERVLSERLNGMAAAGGWSADGETLVFTATGNPDTGIDIFTVRLDAGEAPEPLVQTPDLDSWPTVSPNGRWLAYVSDETGERRIYVRPFPDAASGGRRVISEGPGERPLWGRDGQELFYHTAESAMVVPVETGDTFQRGTPRRLFSMEPYDLSPAFFHWDVSTDGEQFLMVKRGEATDENAQPSQVIVVQNWAEELKGMFPE